jgi:hypothetical protein
LIKAIGRWMTNLKGGNGVGCTEFLGAPAQQKRVSHARTPAHRR